MDIDVIAIFRNNTTVENDKIICFVHDGNGDFEHFTIAEMQPNTLRDLYVSDLNQDGIDDIIYTSSNYLLWLENLGDFQFIDHFLANGDYITHIEAIDFDQDSDLDIFASFMNEDYVIWIENIGNGNFNSAQNLVESRYTSTAKVTDLNKDGYMDMLAVKIGFLPNTAHKDSLFWFENLGNESFEKHLIYPFEGNQDNQRVFSSIEVKDINKDGDLDIIVGSFEQRLIWYENDGTQNFEERVVEGIENLSTNLLVTSDIESDGDIDIITAESFFGKIAIFQNNTIDHFAKIEGVVFWDKNQNQEQDEDEIGLPNHSVLLSTGNLQAYSSENGQYLLRLGAGNHSLTHGEHPLWEMFFPTEGYNFEVDDNNKEFMFRFGVIPTRILPRVESHINSTPTRCNTASNYWLNYSNTGTTIANGTITLEVDELMTFTSSNPEPDLIEGRKLTWNIVDLHPSFENQIQLQFQMPDFNSMGETLKTQASIQLFNDNQELTYSKSTEYDSEVLCSYDPNDKLTRSNLLGQSEFAYIEDTILYTVRFQNTGNDTAFNIRIEDVLDKKLDLTTFHPITASHNYRTELNRETGLATFFFDDIMLPDSTTNEEESHGFVMFGIASLEGIEDKTELDNTASIFFDFNPAIITNTATLTLIEQVETDIEAFHSNHSIHIYPNPFSDYTSIEVSNLPKGNYRLQVMGILGRKVRELDLKSGKVDLERGGLESGLYLVKVLEEGSLEVIGSEKIIVR
ncbi:MAG: FG-GAP-like repeat-containing protein, partial [Chitinophagales bacterium]